MADFSLKAVFGLDATGVKTELKQLRNEVNDFAETWGKVAIAAAGAAFVALAKGAVELGAKLKDNAEAASINVEELQKLNYLAEQNGTSQEVMQKALEKTRAFMAQATAGSEMHVKSLRDLGISATAMANIPLERKFQSIALAYANAEDKAEAYNAVSDIFGEKIAPKMLASLTVLAEEGFGALGESAQEAGAVMSTSTIVALEKTLSKLLLKGTAFFEVLPILLNSGFEDVACVWHACLFAGFFEQGDACVEHICSHCVWLIQHAGHDSLDITPDVAHRLPEGSWYTLRRHGLQSFAEVVERGAI
jgi:hypothetical protein